MTSRFVPYEKMLFDFTDQQLIDEVTRRRIPSHLLTELELEAMDLTATLANKLSEIIKAGNNSDVASRDWDEAARLIHLIQHMIMAQAAARAYPDRYRVLGSRFQP